MPPVRRRSWRRASSTHLLKNMGVWSFLRSRTRPSSWVLFLLQICNLLLAGVCEPIVTSDIETNAAWSSIHWRTLRNPCSIPVDQERADFAKPCRDPAFVVLEVRRLAQAMDVYNAPPPLVTFVLRSHAVHLLLDLMSSGVSTSSCIAHARVPPTRPSTFTGAPANSAEVCRQPRYHVWSVSQRSHLRSGDARL